MEPYFAGPGWKWPLSTNLGSNSLHKNMPSCLSISSGAAKLAISSNSRRVGSTLLHKYVRSCISMSWSSSLAMAFSGERLKTLALVFVQWEYGTGLAGNVKGQGSSHFLKTPQMQSIGQCMVGTLQFQYHLSTPSYGTLLPTNWGQVFFVSVDEAPFPWDDEDPFLDVLWYETVGKMKNLTKQTLDQWSGGLKINLCFKSNKLFWCKIDQKSGRESQSNLAILQQMGRESYIHSVRLEFHFCTFCDFNLTFTTCNCCISSLFVLPNHWRCLKCLASVVALVKVSLLPTAQPMHQHQSALIDTLCHKPKGGWTYFGGFKKENDDHMMTKSHRLKF